MDHVRQNEIDWLKGLGIILVVLMHYTAQYTYNIISAFHMPLFFFVGGYLYKTKPRISGIKKDFSRLIFPYLLSNVAIILFFLFWGHRHDNYSMMIRQIKAIFYSCATIEQNSKYLASVPTLGPLWFLTAMFWCKNIFNFIQTKYQQIIAFVLGILATFVQHSIINAPLGLLTGCSAMMFYAIGSYAKGNPIFEKPRAFIFFISLIMWGISSYFYPLASCNCSYPNLPINILGAIGAVYIFYHIAKRYSSKLLEWFGRNSLTILCVHSFFYFTRNYFSAKFVSHLEYLFFFDLAASIIFILLVDSIKNHHICFLERNVTNQR